jgi:hypothetical protein
MPYMKNLFLMVMFLSGQTLAQENFWQVLAEVHFKQEKDGNGYEMDKPVFSNHLKSYQKKKIVLKGYIIPLEESGGNGKFMLSSLPFNVCYFCGAAGPETVVEIETTERIKFTTRQIAMQGILILNENDPDHHIYILRSAEIVTP